MKAFKGESVLKTDAAPEDSRIVEMFFAREERAISAVSDKYGTALRRIAMNILGDDGLAEECENDAYLKAWNTVPPNDPSAYLFAYLAKIIRAAAIDRVRRQTAGKRSVQYTELTQEIEERMPYMLTVEDEVDGSLLQDAVGRFLQTQSSEKRGIFLRRYWFMDSIADIAKRYGVTKGKIKSVLFRLREELKEYLEKEGFKI